MSNPTPNDVDTELRRIAQASSPTRQLARERVAVYRQRATPYLTQEQIDSGYDAEERRQRFVSGAVRFKRRSWWSRLFR